MWNPDSKLSKGLTKVTNKVIILDANPILGHK